MLTPATVFKPCPIGFYPIVDHSDWLEKLLPIGVEFIQLRIKNMALDRLKHEIQRSISLAKNYKATLFINDYWELAIEYGADGVHLGQEDLNTADIEKIHSAGLYLGISTHCLSEVLRAQAIHPSYMAYGPIYPTTSKVMPYPPQGLFQLQAWRKRLDCPLVAIGGINLERLSDVLKTGVRGVSVISAVTKAENPLDVTKQFLHQIKTQQLYSL